MSATASDLDRAPSRYDLGRVLVIDDRPESRHFIARCLGAEGFEAAACESGGDVTTVFGSLEPDLVVMAAELDHTPAGQLCMWIRARSGVPIVVAAEVRNHDAVDVLDLGADVIVRTPISERELVARVRAVLRRNPPRWRSGDEVVGFGGMKLDRVARVLHLEERSLQLDGRDFVLMELLVLGAGTVTPRRTLEAVLGVTGAELDTYVRRLRARIEAIEGWRRIVSERSVGLRLLEERPYGPNLSRPSAPESASADGDEVAGEYGDTDDEPEW